MQILFSSLAMEYVKTAFKPKEDDVFKLIYDTDGCGCAVNGVPTLHLANKATLTTEIEICSNDVPIFIFKKHMIFFDDEMQVDLKDSALILKSKNQIFTKNLHISK